MTGVQTCALPICSKELGKTLGEARGDVLKAIEPTEHACSLPTLVQGDASLQVTTGFDTATYRMPLGVVAGIVPFNFPAMIPWIRRKMMWKIRKRQRKSWKIPFKMIL